MTKNKYDYTITDIRALHAAFPKAVQVQMNPVRSVITKLLDCGVPLPGVVLAAEPDESPAGPPPGQQPETAESQDTGKPPSFFRKHQPDHA